jgi:hypothetical protein
MWQRTNGRQLTGSIFLSETSSRCVLRNYKLVCNLRRLLSTKKFYPIFYALFQIFFSLNFAAGDILGIFILAYFGMRVLKRHFWLKYISAMQFSNFILETSLCFQNYVPICRSWKYVEGSGVVPWVSGFIELVCRTLCFRVHWISLSYLVCQGSLNFIIYFYFPILKDLIAYVSYY